MQVAALLLGESRRRRLLDELLVATLERAVALAERDDMSVGVGEQLHLDVTRRQDLALEVDGPVAERGRRLARTGHERRREVLRAGHAPHAAAAAAGRGLDEQREADPPSRSR